MSGSSVAHPQRSARRARRALAWEAVRGVRQRGALGAAQPGRPGCPRPRVRHVAGPGAAWLAAGPARLPGHRRRRPHPADHGHQHRGHRDRPGPRPHRGRPAAVLHRSSRPGCCATSCATAAPRWCSVSSSPPSSTVPPACSPSAWPRVSGPKSSRGWPSAGRSCCCSPAWPWWSYFADHLAHSIQIDAINRRVETNTRRVIARLADRTVGAEPRAPDWAVPLLARTVGLPADDPPRAAAAAGQPRAG